MPQIHRRRVCYDRDPNTCANHHGDVLNPPELNAIINLTTQACCALSQMSFQRRIGQPDKWFANNIRKFYRLLTADAMLFARDDDELVLCDKMSLQNCKVSSVGHHPQIGTTFRDRHGNFLAWPLAKINGEIRT